MSGDTQYKKLERIIKGFANHRRLEMLDLLKREPNLTIEVICERLNIGYFNASDHIRKMALASLLTKRTVTGVVLHSLTPLGESILAFCKKLK